MLMAVQIIGAVLLLVGFVGLTQNWMSEYSPRYLWLNVIGAGLLALSAWMTLQFGFAVLNTVWLLAAAHALRAALQIRAAQRRVEAG